jgi:hypothetical protein
MSVVYSRPYVSCVQQSVCQLCTAVRVSVMYSSPWVSCVKQSVGQLCTAVRVSVVYSSPYVSCVQQSTCQLCTAVLMSVVYSSPYVSCVQQSICQLCTEFHMSVRYRQAELCASWMKKDWVVWMSLWWRKAQLLKEGANWRSLYCVTEVKRAKTSQNSRYCCEI